MAGWDLSSDILGPNFFESDVKHTKKLSALSHRVPMIDTPSWMLSSWDEAMIVLGLDFVKT